MFFLLYKRTDNGVFDDFPKISDHFPKISEDFPKLSRRPDERFRTFPENCREFSKMSEDCRRLSRKTRRCYTNEFKYNLRDKPDATEIIDIFTCEDIISSHVRISYRFCEFVTTRYTTDFYIINKSIKKLQLFQSTLLPYDSRPILFPLRETVHTPNSLRVAFFNFGASVSHEALR